MMSEDYNSDLMKSCGNRGVNRYTQLFFLLVLVMIFITSRLVGLSSDIPFGWEIAQYQHFDEVFYSMMAVNHFHYGHYDVSPFGCHLIDVEAFISLPVWNYFTLWLLDVIENPLIAIRLPAVIAGTVVYVVYLMLISRIVAHCGKFLCKETLFLLGFAVIPIVDPAFFLASSVNEPTVYRLTVAALIILLLMVFDKENSYAALLLGGLSAFSVVFVYLYNAFIPFFVLVSLLWMGWRRSLIWFFVGLVGVLLVYFIAFEWLLDIPLLKSFAMLSSSGVRSVMSLAPIDVFSRVALSFSTNFFAFSPYLLALFVSGVAFVMVSGWVGDSYSVKLASLSIIYIASFLLQSVFISDFVPRKGIILYLPVLLFCWSVVLVQIRNNSPVPKKAFWVGSFFLVVFSLLLFYVSKLSLLLRERGFFDSISTLMFFSPNVYIYVFAAFTLACMIFLFFNRPTVKIYAIGIPLVMTLVLNCQLLLRYKYGRPHSSFSDAIRSISRLPPGYMIGNLSYSFSFANKMNKPVLYLYTPKIMGVKGWNSSNNSLNSIFFSRAIGQKLSGDYSPIYSVVMGLNQAGELMQSYPSAAIVSSLTYRDVESYYTDFMKSPLGAIQDSRIFVVKTR